MVVVDAFSIEQASRLSGLTTRQLAYWARTGLYPHGAKEERPTFLVYSFRDVLALRTIAELQTNHGFSTKRLRAVGRVLREHHEEPWVGLELYVAGREVAFRHPGTGEVESTRRPGQLVEVRLSFRRLERELHRAVNALRKRAPEAIGVANKRRSTMGGAEVFAGTRVPVSIVCAMLEDGATDDAILHDYPRLTKSDLELAKSAVRKRRSKKAA